MLAGLGFAFSVSMLTVALALRASVMLARMMLMAVRLSLDLNEEVLSCLGDGVNECIVSVGPFALLVLFLVVFCEGFLGDFVVEEGRGGGFEGCGASGVGAFNFGGLDAADTVIVVVDGCLENYLLSVLFISQVTRTENLP